MDQFLDSQRQRPAPLLPEPTVGPADFSKFYPFRIDTTIYRSILWLQQPFTIVDRIILENEKRNR